MLAQLGRTRGKPEAPVDRFLGGTIRERLERRHVPGRAGRADELGPEASRLRNDQADRNALDGDTDGVPLLALDDRDNERQALERVQRPARIVRGDHDGQVERELAAAARIPGDLPVQGLGDCLQQRPAAIER